MSCRQRGISSRHGTRGAQDRAACDQAGDGEGLGDVDRVAARRFGGRRAGPLGHRPLREWRDHPVVGRDQVPARLAAPNWVARVLLHASVASQRGSRDPDMSPSG